MDRYGRRKSTKGRTALLVIGTIALLILLFLLSFWVTSVILKSNQGTEDYSVSGASPTAKPTYEQLESMVIEKDKKIKELTEQIEVYRTKGTATQAAKATVKPTAAPSVKATAAPTAKPTAKPTVKPTTNPTTKPAQAAPPEDN